MAEDALEMEADLENPTFAYKDVEYACTPSGITRGANFQEGGNQVIRTVILLVRAALFTDESPAPTAKNTINYPGNDGFAFTVEDVVTMPGETLLKITAHRKGKGA